GGVVLINDSKATNASRAGTALAAFPGDIFWIAGGKPKAGGISSLAAFFPRISKAYLIGEASDEFAATLKDQVAFVRCGSLEVAVATAAADAAGAGKAGAVVLLSPACASYDQVRHFEVRGDVFRALVARVPGVTMESRDGIFLTKRGVRARGGGMAWAPAERNRLAHGGVT